MTITLLFCSQTTVQKSAKVVGSGPCVEIYRRYRRAEGEAWRCSLSLRQFGMDGKDGDASAAGSWSLYSMKLALMYPVDPGERDCILTRVYSGATFNRHGYRLRKSCIVLTVRPNVGISIESTHLYACYYAEWMIGQVATCSWMVGHDTLQTLLLCTLNRLGKIFPHCC